MISLCRSLVLVVFLILPVSSVWAGPAGWYWGIGYHNPPSASLGLNFTHLWNEWALEFGVGYLNASDDRSCRSDVDQSSFKCYYANASSRFASLSMAGAVSGKYLLGSGSIRPYVVAGTYAGLSLDVGDSIQLDGSIGNGFSGLGFLFFGDRYDFYISYLFIGASTLQLGFNF